MGKKPQASAQEAKLPEGIIRSSRYGVQYLRSKPLKVANPRTPRQVNQRNKMKLSLDFLKANIELVRTGFRFYKAKRSAFNAALSYVLEHSFTGTGADLEIDYSRVLLSRGELEKPLEAKYELKDSEIVVTWKGNTDQGNAKASDRSMISVYSPEKEEAVLVLREGKRSEGSQGQRIVLPASFGVSGFKVFLAFDSEDELMVSDSVLCAEVVELVSA